MTTAHAAGKNSRAVKNNNESSTLLKTLVAFKNGNFAVRMPVDRTGIEGKIADALNDVIELNQRMTSELDRISPVGRRGGQDCTAGFHWVRERALG